MNTILKGVRKYYGGFLPRFKDDMTFVIPILLENPHKSIRKLFNGKIEYNIDEELLLYDNQATLLGIEPQELRRERKYCDLHLEKFEKLKIVIHCLCSELVTQTSMN